jgi:ferredoxin-NADP reductase
MSQIIKIIAIANVTHDVLHITAEKPDSLAYSPGQAVDISINKPGWEKKKRPFTFTSLPSEEQIEFTIKTYPARQGVTNQLLSLVPGDELIIYTVFGTIIYQGEGIFIAGGAGVTPFIAIFKDLESTGKLKGNKLICANKTKEDIILKDWFSQLLGNQFINILSEEDAPGYAHGRIDKKFIQQSVDAQRHYYYICGPDPMMDAIAKDLTDLGVDEKQIIREKF